MKLEAKVRLLAANEVQAYLTDLEKSVGHGKPDHVPLRAYQTLPAVKYKCSSPHEVEKLLAKLKEYVKSTGGEQIGRIDRDGPSPADPRLSQWNYIVGNNLYLLLAFTGFQEKKEHCMYVVAYKG